MAGNIPGTNNSVLPGAYTQIETQSTGVSIPGGTRIVAIIGEGIKEEVIVASASGGGQDGFSPDYTSVANSDGRHFKLSGLISPELPIIPNTIKLYKKSFGGEVQLKGKEEPITSSDLDDQYDFRIDLNSGKIQLQKASIKVQNERTGQKYTVPSGQFANKGDGYISDISALNPNAPPEKWTVKCVGVQKDSSGNPVTGTAQFIAFGSVSGNKLVNGSQVVWTSDGNVKDNGIVKFSVYQSLSSSILNIGDSFTFEVKSGVLAKDDSLRAEYIPSSNIGDPTFLSSMNDIAAKHGTPSVENTLSLGAQLAIANGAPGVMCVQAKPAIPKRTSYTLSDSTSLLDPNSKNTDDFVFPLPPGVRPNTESQIHFFLTNHSDPSKTEKQYLPNKVPFYTVNDVPGFVSASTGSNAFSYTVVDTKASVASGLDGEITTDPSSIYDDGYLKSNSIVFNGSHVNSNYILKVIDSSESNNSEFTIKSVHDGKLKIAFKPIKDEANVRFDFIDNIKAVIPDTTQISIPTSPVTTKIISDLLGSVKYANLVTSTVTDGYLVIDTSSLLIDEAAGLNTWINDPQYVSNIKVYDSSIGQSGLYEKGNVYTTSSNSSQIAEIKIELIKYFSVEENLRFEIIDTSNNSPHIVINKSVALANHSLRVTLIDEKDADFYDAGWLEALASLEAQDVDIIVPLPRQNISAIFQNTLTHCKVASSIKNKRERVMFCGAIRGLTPDNLIGSNPKLVAVEDIGVLEGIQGDDDVLTGTKEDLANYSVSNAFGYGAQSYRSVYFYPDEIVVQANGENKFVDGFYMAAAAGGYLSASTNIAMPLTNKTLSGFTILSKKKLTNLKKELMADSGITVVDPIQGGGRVVWGKTTTKSGYPEEEEISIVFVRDRIAKAMRESFAGYIGLPEDASLAPTLTARAVSTLNSFVSQNLITQYTGLQVQRDTVDPRQWNISFKVQPNYPVNFIFIKVSLGII